MTPREAMARSVTAFEGGDSDHPDDRGGVTRFGLTFVAFQEERPGGTLEQFRALSRDEVIDILTERCVLKPGYWRIADHWVMWAMADFALHSHHRTATRHLQRVLKVAADGIFGRQTEHAVSRANPERLFRQLMASRVRLLGQIIRRDRSQAAFAGGWFDRVATILEAAA